MTKTITPRQTEILEMIQTFDEQMGYSPSLSELERMLGITKRGVVKHLEALERKGLIQRSSQARGIRLVKRDQGQMLLNIQVLGYANAGQPMVNAEEETLGYLRVNRSLLPISRNIFALIIKGDSMNTREVVGGNLDDGKYALIAKDQDINNGDVVLAIIDSCATIKTFKKQQDMIILYPESTNDHHKPFYLDATKEDNGSVYGKVVAVLDNPKF